MEFTIYRKSDGYPVRLSDFAETAAQNGLQKDYLHEFMLSENGVLVLTDTDKHYMTIPKEGKYLIEICLPNQGTLVKILY